MKKITRTLVAVCAMCALLASCREKRAEKPQFNVIGSSDTFRANGSSFDLDYRFEYLSWYQDSEVEANIRTSMLADFFGEEYVSVNPMQTATRFEEAVAEDFSKSTTGGDYTWNGIMKIRSYKDIVNDRILAYTIERSEYMGGAHGMETVEYSNYDLRTGKRLTLDDLFTAEGKSALAGRIREAILKDHRKDTWEELGQDNCYLAENQIQPIENFLLGANHITFLYNPYEIACYAQGRTKVRLSLNDLDGFRKDVLDK